MKTRTLNGTSTWKRSSAAVACAVCLGIGALGCGGETGTGTQMPRKDTGVRAPDLGPGVRYDTGPAAYLDGGAPPPAPDTGTVQGNCPAASEIVGSYSGTYKGTVTAGLPFSLTGTLAFTLAEGAAPNEYSIQNGKLQGAVLGLAYSLPMQGKVVCGVLDGAGTGDVSGVKLNGTYKATWVPGGFPSGSWTGQDADKKASGNGTWQAKKQ